MNLLCMNKFFGHQNLLLIQIQMNVNTTDQSQQDEMQQSQNASKHFESSEFYQKFILGQNLLNESDRRIDNPLVQSQDINNIKTKVMSLNKQLHDYRNENMLLERQKQEQDARLQSYKQQNQNLIREVERLQRRVDNQENDKQPSSMKEEIQGLRTRILTETNAKNRAVQQQEEFKNQLAHISQLLDDQTIQLNAKIDEIRLLERTCEQFKNEVNTARKKIQNLEDSLADVRAQSQNAKDEVQVSKSEVIRQQAQSKHLQLENFRLRKEIDIIKVQLEKSETKLREQKEVIGQLQVENENTLRVENSAKLRQQLEVAYQEINKYRAMTNNIQAQEYLIERQSSPVKITNNVPSTQQNEIQTIAFNNPTIPSQKFNAQQHFTHPDTKSFTTRAPLQLPTNQTLAQHSKLFQPVATSSQLNNPTQSSIERNIKSTPANLNINFGSLQVGETHLLNMDQIQSIENQIMMLSQRKTEIEGNLQRMESQKMRSQALLTRKKNLDQELEYVEQKIQSLRKELRNYTQTKV